MGIGAPIHTGGYIQYVNTYGLDRFIARCEELTTKYGPRFHPPAILREYVAEGRLFPPRCVDGHNSNFFGYYCGLAAKRTT